MSELQSLTAHTALGDLRGVQHGRVVQFRGVPYAAPPVGELRFAPPQEVAGWTGVRDATQHGPIAPQRPSRLTHVMGDFSRSQSEDCLTLTISTPAPGPGKRPVLVWLHGGAFLSGAGSLDWYDGATLAAEGDLVVVGVNYRLGALGFLCYPGLGDGAAGVRDTIAALRWVQEHIASFGGDPGQVTVVGQSAGASIILYLLALGEAAGLFQRAILQSPSAGRAPLSEAVAQERADRLLDLSGIDRSDPSEVVARLRAEPVERLLDATFQLARATARFGEVAPPLLPVFDELAAPGSLLEAAASGAGAAGVSLVIGTTRDEAHAFYPDPDLTEPEPGLLGERFAALLGGAGMIEVYRRRRPGSRTRDLLSDLVTDTVFTLPSLRFAALASQAGARSWAYQFDWSPPGSALGACHCIELPFVFGNPDAWTEAPMLRGADPIQVAELSGAIRASWISFVRAGDPDTGSTWPTYLPNRQTMRFGEMVGAVGDLAGITWRRMASSRP